MDNILEIKNLIVREKSQNKTILDNINLFLKPGKILGLVGETGSGKTILSYSILGLLDNNFLIDGKIIYKNKNILRLEEIEKQKMRGSEISMIFQEPLSALNPLHLIKKQIVESVILKNSKISAKKIDEKIAKIFETVKLSDSKRILNSYPHQLSGGQRQRIAVAIAIINQPKVLLADEPTSSLDAISRLKTLDYLKNLSSDLDMSMIFISHNIKEVARIADYLAVIRKGKIEDFGLAKDIIKQPKSRYSKQLLNSHKILGKKTQKKEKEILRIDNLNLSFPQRSGILQREVASIDILKNINLVVQAGHSLGILGESGSGKTSLVFAILRLLKDCKINGKSIIDGSDWQQLNIKALLQNRSKAQIVFQDPFTSLSPRMSINQIVKEGLDLHYKSLSTRDKQAKVQAALKQVNLPSDSVDRYPHEFSGGERQRIALARVLVLSPKLIIMDEPTSSLDKITERKIVELLRKLQADMNLSYLIISHDLDIITQLCDNIAVIKEGRIVETNTSRNLISKPKDAYTKLLIKSSAYQIEF